MGDLVYIPSETQLTVHAHDDEQLVKAYDVLEHPCCCLVLEEKKNHLLIENKGTKWLVKKKQVHRIGENNAS